MQAMARPHPEPSSARPGDPDTGIPADVLEQWLCDPALPLPSLSEIAETFGVGFAVVDADDEERLARGLRLSLAILRDVFPTDEALRRWLRAPSFELGGDRPFDLLLAGHAERLELCAVRAWNRMSQSFPSSGDES